MKAMVAERLGYEPLPTPEQLEVVFKEGNLHEQAVVEQLVSEGFAVESSQLEVNISVSKEILLQGHLDGIISNAILPRQSGKRVLEVKSMSKDAWDQFRDKGWETPGLIQKYKWQLSAYMVATGLEAYVVAKNRNNGQLLRMGVEEPFYTKERMRARVLAIEAQVRSGRLPDSCDNRIWPCPFLYLHDDEPPLLTSDTALDALCARYKAASLDLTAAGAARTEARTRLAEALNGRDKVLTERFRVVSYEQANHPTYDVWKMMEDGVEVEKYKVQEKSTRIRVTEREAHATDSPQQ